jgi:hypothetical protein
MGDPKFCKDCKHSATTPNCEWSLMCTHPRVVGKSAWALARATYNGTECTDERRLRWPSPCGMRGALWETK